MRKVFLVTGFNNWGKTRILCNAFGVRAFRHDRLYPFQSSNCDFLVLPKSNDDLGLRGYCEDYYDRIAKIREQGIRPKYIASAFCPTKERVCRTKGGPKTFTSIDIIRELYGKDEVHILLLEYKWCGHARLRPQEITAFYSTEQNVTVHSIGAATYPPRLAALSNAIAAQLP
jgi:hypothetical protein